jgi:hypothetical protein
MRELLGGEVILVLGRNLRGADALGLLAIWICFCVRYRGFYVGYIFSLSPARGGTHFFCCAPSLLPVLGNKVVKTSGIGILPTPQNPLAATRFTIRNIPILVPLAVTRSN